MLGFTLEHPDPVFLKGLGVWEWMNRAPRTPPMFVFILDHPGPVILKDLGVWGCMARPPQDPPQCWGSPWGTLILLS